MSVIEWMLCVGLLVLALFDLKDREIPWIPVAIGGCILLGVRLWQGSSWLDIGAGILPGMALLLLSRLTKGGVGEGDGIVLMVLGVGIGVAKTIAVFSGALFFCAVAAVITVLVRHGGFKTELPFLPFLFLGYIGSVCYAL